MVPNRATHHIYCSTCKYLNISFLSTNSPNSFISKFLLYLNILLHHLDLESNPGPDKTKAKNFSCCHWNVNSLVAHKHSKHRQLEAYNSIYNYDFICISETYIDFSVTQNSEEIQLDGYSLVRSDRPGNSKKGGACLYYKESLGVKIIINFTALSECILCEV